MHKLPPRLLVPRLPLLLLLFAAAVPYAAGAAPRPEQPGAAKTAMPVIDWFSLAPANAGLVRAPRMDLAAPSADGSEYITVYGRKRKPDFAETPGSILNEPSHIDAAQSFTPYMGEGCTRYTVCTDPEQPGLSDSFGGLIGQH
jgi:hypothetical protein